MWFAHNSLFPIDGASSKSKLPLKLQVKFVTRLGRASLGKTCMKRCAVQNLPILGLSLPLLFQLSSKLFGTTMFLSFQGCHMQRCNTVGSFKTLRLHFLTPDISRRVKEIQSPWYHALPSLWHHLYGPDGIKSAYNLHKKAHVRFSTTRLFFFLIWHWCFEEDGGGLLSENTNRTYEPAQFVVLFCTLSDMRKKEEMKLGLNVKLLLGREIIRSSRTL